MNTETTTAAGRDHGAELKRIRRAMRAAEHIEAAVARVNTALGHLPEALRQLGNAPAFTCGHVPRDLHPVRDLLAELEAAGHALRAAVRAAQALDTGLHRAATAEGWAAQLAAGAWAVDVAATFAPALAYFGVDAVREDLAELAGACAWDMTGWPWSQLDAINARLAVVDQRLTREIRLDARGYLRAHELDMADLRAAGLGRLAARVEFECRAPLRSIQRVAGLGDSTG